MPEWVDHSFALIHGDDRDERQRNMGAWKARHTDPAWGEFGLRVCSETATWADIYQALHEPPPLGAETVAVIAPSLGELLMKKDIPEAMLRLLQAPPPHLRFLGVAMGTVTEAKGKGLGRAPWTQWNQKGQVLKVGVLAPLGPRGSPQSLPFSFGDSAHRDA